MDRESLEFVTNALKADRIVFHDFADRFALIIFARLLGEGSTNIKEFKKSRFKPLFQKSCMKTVLSRLGGMELKAEDLLYGWPTETEPFRISLASWPELDEKPSRRLHQVTRWGWSLVLQINASATHRRKLAELVPDWESEVTYYFGHPIAGGGELTIGWVRIDLDLQTGEALIEEIQSDWIRRVKRLRGFTFYPREVHRAWIKYHDKILAPVASRWPETALTAALWFLLEEVGISTIFIHTFESGIRLKSIDGGQPPRSIYSSLPKKFCFEQSHNGPLFIRDSARTDLRKLFMDPETKWWVLEFGDGLSQQAGIS